MDVNERFEQWLQSLTKECEDKASQIKGEKVTITTEKKKDKKKKKKRDKKHSESNHAENGASNGINGQDSGFRRNKDGSHQDDRFGDSLITDHDDLNEILNELASIQGSSSSFHSDKGDDGGFRDSLEPAIDSGGIHVMNTDGQQPKFLYAEPNATKYTYFQPDVLSLPERQRSKLSQFLLKQIEWAPVRFCSESRNAQTLPETKWPKT